MGDIELEGVDLQTWGKWMLEAIKKIRSQKQRPSAERIIHAIRQHHNFHEDVIAEALDQSVKSGTVLKVFNKGQSTYKDPGGVPIRQLNLAKCSDLSRVVVKAARELGERDGSSLKSIERHIQLTYELEVPPNIDLGSVLRLSTKRAIARGQLVKRGNNFKPVEEVGCNSARKRNDLLRKDQKLSNLSGSFVKVREIESLRIFKIFIKTAYVYLYNAN